MRRMGQGFYPARNGGVRRARQLLIRFCRTKLDSINLFIYNMLQIKLRARGEDLASFCEIVI